MADVKSAKAQRAVLRAVTQYHTAEWLEANLDRLIVQAYNAAQRTECPLCHAMDVELVRLGTEEMCPMCLAERRPVGERTVYTRR